MFEQLKKDTLQQIANASDLEQLERLRVVLLGKKGVITEQVKSIGKLPAEERPKAGKVLNELKEEIQKAIEAKKEELERIESQKLSQKMWVDVTTSRSQKACRPQTSYNENA